MKTMRLSLIFLMAVVTLFSAGDSWARVRRQRGNLAPTTGGVAKSIVVDGAERQALVFSPTTSVPATGSPLIVVFHGHGGNIRHTAANFRLQELWPEAMVVYLQGLTGVPGRTDLTGAKPGWQKDPGDQNDRDLKFFDAALAQIETKAKIDPKRIYLFGFSNGARFANVVWNQRGDKIAALCSASAQGGELIKTSIPRSLFMVMGENDQTAPYAWQKQSIPLAQQRLSVDLAAQTKDGYLTMAKAASGLELWTYVHPGGHPVPPGIPAKAVEFFKRHNL
jgi:polyhydroxybutyrate depolymerase